jgi:hypothetical protein
MPVPAQRSDREFLPSTNQALADLEESTGKPVLIQEDEDLKVLATIHRAESGESCHVLRVKDSREHVSDYLIAFECRMALRDGLQPRAVLVEKRNARERLISDVEKLHRKLPVAKARELGKFMYNGLIVQLRSTGPGLLVDRWIREHCPDLREPQARSIESQINENLGVLQAGSRANFPARLYDASIAMNAAYAIYGGDLLGKPHLSVPYVSQGHGALARRLIAAAVGNEDSTTADRLIIDAWAEELGVSSWYDWSERTA